MTRYELIDPEWERVAPLLPPTYPWTNHRNVLKGIDNNLIGGNNALDVTIVRAHRP